MSRMSVFLDSQCKPYLQRRYETFHLTCSKMCAIILCCSATQHAGSRWNAVWAWDTGQVSLVYSKVTSTSYLVHTGTMLLTC